MMRWGIALLTVIGTAALSPAADAPAKTSLVIDQDKKQVIIDAQIAPRKLEHLKDQNEGKPFPIEVIACWPHPKGKKAHETVVTIAETVKPSDVHKALESLGAKTGAPAAAETERPTGAVLTLFLELPGSDGTPARRVSIDKAVVDARSGKPLPKSIKFLFTGSVMVKPDPNKPETIYGADLGGTLIAIMPVTAETVLQGSITLKEGTALKLETDKKVLPKEGTPVKLILQLTDQK